MCIRQVMLMLGAVVMSVWGESLRADATDSAARMNQQLTVGIQGDQLQLQAALMLNRPGAFREVRMMDRNADGALTPAEQAAYFESVRQEVMGALDVSINGEDAALEQVGEMELAMPFRKTFRFQASLPKDWQRGVRIEIHNDAYLAISGDTAIDVQASDGVDLTYWSTNESDPSENENRDIVIQCRSGTGRLLKQPIDPPSVDLAVAYDQTKIDDGSRVVIIVVCGSVLAVGLLITFHARPIVWLLVVITGVGFTAYFRSDSKPHADGRSPVISTDQATEVFRSLHDSLYQAYATDDEERVYEALNQCVSGDFLDRMYIEARLKTKREGTYTVRRTKTLHSDVLRRSNDGFEIRYRWRVYGTVTHSGHRHARRNEYQATYTVADIDGRWRIVDAIVESQRRIDGNADRG